MMAMKYITLFILLTANLSGQSVSNKIEFVAKSDLDHYKEVISLKFAESEKALQIQATEYERRLEVLNHEAAQLKDMQSTYVSRDLFDATIKEISAKHESTRETVLIGTGVFIALQIGMAFFLKSKKITEA